ncbi:MAG TPA: 6-phosphogluconolactonase, partial [candidate division Zixibacteria bacterium]|nr:6-phosphogluconolactonase [candidate division Zixibacteria bacterium]
MKVFKDYETMSRAAADLFLELAASAIAEFGRFAVALSGGSTPHKLYRVLSSFEYASRIEWNRVHVFWGDERCVPRESPDSNSG